MPKSLNITDRAWLLADRHDMPLHVAGLAVFTPPEGAGEDYLRKLVAQLRDHHTCASPFNKKLRRSRFSSVAPKWTTLADGGVDLDYHVRHSALPRPGGQRELGVLVSRLHSRPLDPTRPLWEVHVIEGLEGGRFAMYMKVHHALMDGVGGMRRLTGMLSTDSTDATCPPPWAVGPARTATRPAAKPPLARRVRKVAKLSRSFAATAGRITADAVRRPDPMKATLFASPRSVLNEQITQQRRVSTQSFELDRLKRVGKQAGATVNDVLLAMCSSALRRYLRDIGRLPRENLTAVTPVSVRAADDSSAGNAFTLILVNLHTRIADPVARLLAIHESSREAKEELTRLPKVVAANFGLLMFAPFIVGQLLRFAGRIRPPVNLIISNVPGPNEPLYFNGARLEDLHPVSLVFDGGALNVTAVSAAGRFNIGVVGCRDALPHMQRFAVYHGEALAELEEALGLS